MKVNELHKEIFSWMNQHPSEVVDMTIVQISKKLFTTPSTVTKTLQTYGYKGLKEFKAIVLASSLSLNSNTHIVQNMLDRCSKALKESDFIESMRMMSNKIETAKNVYLVGLGYSNMICEFLARIIVNKFNKEVILVPSKYIINSATKDSLVIGVSLDRSSVFVKEITETPSFQEADSILITKNISKFDKVKVNKFGDSVFIPNSEFYLDHQDEPIISKIVFEMASTIYLKQGGKDESNS